MSLMFPVALAEFKAPVPLVFTEDLNSEPGDSLYFKALSKAERIAFENGTFHLLKDQWSEEAKSLELDFNLKRLHDVIVQKLDVKAEFQAASAEAANARNEERESLLLERNEIFKKSTDICQKTRKFIENKSHEVSRHMSTLLSMSAHLCLSMYRQLIILVKDTKVTEKQKREVSKQLKAMQNKKNVYVAAAKKMREEWQLWRNDSIKVEPHGGLSYCGFAGCYCSTQFVGLMRLLSVNRPWLHGS